MTAIPRLPPSPDVDRRALRRSLLADPVLAVAGFLTRYPAVYGRLVAERMTRGTRPELEAEALALAADIATVMQSVRGQATEAVVVAIHPSGGEATLPLAEVDQLFSALVLLAGDTAAGIPPEMLLDGDALTLAITTPTVTGFLAGVERADTGDESADG